MSQTQTQEFGFRSPVFTESSPRASCGSLFGSLGSDGGGTWTIDQNLTDLVKRNLISIPEARNKAANKDSFVGG